jgi:hypothetical protein
MRLEPETELQEMMDAWIADMTDGRKERTVCQEATGEIHRRWSQTQEKRRP